MKKINVITLGCSKNTVDSEHLMAQLEAAGFTTAVNRDLPPNDGCISLGQAVVAWAKTDGGA